MNIPAPGDLPAHGVLGHELHVVGKNSAAAERPHQRLAESPLVGALHVAVGGDDRAQVLAELHVGRRAVVDGADADREELPGDVARFLREGLDERVAERHPIRTASRFDAGNAKKRSVLRRTIVMNASKTAETRTDPSMCGSSFGS